MATLGEYLGAGASTTKLLLHLNGNSNDSSGNGNNGTVNGATSTNSGKFGGAYNFDGSDDYITLPSFSWIDGPFTFSAWIKRNNKNRRETIVYYGKSNYNNCFVIRLLDDSDGNVAEPFWDDSSMLFDLRARGVTPINSDTWYNIIATFEKVSGVAYLKLYVNGNLDKSISESSPGTANGTTYRYIGAGISRGEKQEIDEVIVESVVWTPEKIKKYYTYSKGRFGIL